MSLDCQVLERAISGHGFLTYQDMKDLRKEIDRLRAELAEKDKRIAELEENIRTVIEDPYYLRFLGNALRGGAR